MQTRKRPLRARTGNIHGTAMCVSAPWRQRRRKATWLAGPIAPGSFSSCWRVGVKPSPHPHPRLLPHPRKTRHRQSRQLPVSPSSPVLTTTNQTQSALSPAPTQAQPLSPNHTRNRSRTHRPASRPDNGTAPSARAPCRSARATTTVSAASTAGSSGCRR